MNLARRTLPAKAGLASLVQNLRLGRFDYVMLALNNPGRRAANMPMEMTVRVGRPFREELDLACRTVGPDEGDRVVDRRNRISDCPSVVAVRMVRSNASKYIGGKLPQRLFSGTSLFVQLHDFRIISLQRFQIHRGLAALISRNISYPQVHRRQISAPPSLHRNGSRTTASSRERPCLSRYQLLHPVAQIDFLASHRSRLFKFLGHRPCAD